MKPFDYTKRIDCYKDAIRFFSSNTAIVSFIDFFYQEYRLNVSSTTFWENLPELAFVVYDKVENYCDETFHIPNETKVVLLKEAIMKLE